ncbi:MAG: HD domain-containing protein [Candidatus Kerfeldbacteria bacterium]|nr:HD domain-containing protein [Candidatus Kerfeldbacteria bacterium]
MNAGEYENYISDLLVHDDIQKLRLTSAHWRRDRFEHNYAVGKLSYRLAKILHANVAVAARGGFLHDWYHGHAPGRKRFSFEHSDQHHFRISHEAASNYGEHPRVLHAIRTHFWPWGRMLPKTREAWIVWMADNLIWFEDHWYGLTHAVRERGQRLFLRRT